MDLKLFVELSLSEIIEGIKAAQAKPGGENVAAEMYGGGGNLILGGTSGIFTPVDFDVSVIASNKEGGASLQVAGVTTKEGAERASQNSSRVKFTVHLRLPKSGE